MSDPLHILHLEDDPDYSRFVQDLMEKEKVDAKLSLVKDRKGFEAALARETFDIILADYSLPDYTGLQALVLARQKVPQTPFLLVSGTIGEQAAIESLQAGATDYVLKQWPEKLVPAIKRAIREAQERDQRLRAETQLFRRENYFRALTENVLDVITIVGRNATILYESPSIKRVTGFEPETFIGKDVFTFVHTDDVNSVRRSFEQALQNPEHEARFHYRLRRVDGSWVELEAIGQSRLNDPNIAGVVINSRDVTTQRRLEEQLRQAQKMEAIGQLAGGVAHDFNNILTVIHGHASMLLASGGMTDAAAKSVQQIVQSAERASGLTRQLLTFSRRQVMQPKRLDMNEIVSNMTKMLVRIVGEDVALQVDCWPLPAFVHADASMIEQLLLNLVVNSRDAMPKGGQVTVGVSVLDIKAAHVARHPEARVGKFVCLTVKDTGCGIPRENLRRIFEPFFTTKEVGKGTGLGLATVYGVVNQHQGWIEVESEINKGTSFKVYFPLGEQAGKAEEDKLPEIAVRGGTETILVVEDEEAVRELVCTYLRGMGYQVIEAASGVRAIETWKEHKGAIHLLLTDLVMPDRMNGRELADKLRAERPGLKVIFTSGYSADVVGKEFVLQGELNYLQKPYHPHTLILAVRECLDATGA